MDSKMIDEFTEIFENKREELYKHIESTKIEIDISGDEIDKATGDTIGNLSKSISLRNLKKIKDIDKALIKIKNNCFGICEECGEDIGKQRLLALPDAEMCIICAEKLENENKQFY